MSTRIVEGKWVISTLLILYAMTFMMSMAFLLFFSFLRFAVFWIPQAFSLSNWQSFIWFSLVFSLGFSLTAVAVSIMRTKRRKTVDDYIREALSKNEEE